MSLRGISTCQVLLRTPYPLQHGLLSNRTCFSKFMLAHQTPKETKELGLGWCLSVGITYPISFSGFKP